MNTCKHFFSIHSEHVTINMNKVCNIRTIITDKSATCNKIYIRSFFVLVQLTQNKCCDDIFCTVMLNYGYGKGNYMFILKCNRYSVVECLVRIKYHCEISHVLRLPCQREV